MAWDALANRFQKQQRTEEDKGLAQEAYSASGKSAPGGGFSPQANPTGGFGGTAGSGGGPVSAGFVNFGDLYSANEGKAKQMASDVYRGAESKAEGAKGSLEAARNQFAGKVQQGSAVGTIGGKHGTRIDNYNPTGPEKGTGKEFRQTSEQADPGESGGMPWTAGKHESDKPASQGTTKDGSYMDWGDTSELREPYAMGANTAGVAQYADLFGPSTGVISEGPDDASLQDYHHSVDLLGAKSGAGQDYTGPGSLKESMGDEAYAALAKQMADAEAATKGLGTAGGIAEALGYAGTNSGNAAMDAGLTQTAGQSNFKRLAERYSGLGKELATAQNNSLADVGRADAASDVAAGTWEDLVSNYEAEQAAAAEAAKPEEKKKTQTGNKFDWQEGSNAYALTSESGYTASEVEDAYSSLTPEERAYLNRGNNVFENVTGYGFTGQEAQLKQSILAKLAAARAAKQQGGA